MTLNDWFTKHTKTPIAVLVLFVSLIYLCFVYYAFQTNEEHQARSLKDLIVTSALIGIQQNDRVLIESSLERAVENLGADAAFLCIGEKVVFNTTSGTGSCSEMPKPTFFQRKILFSELGFKDHVIYFLVPRYAINSSHLWVFAITFFVLLLSVGIMFRIRRQFAKDILIPMENSLLSDEYETNIQEFREIKEKIRQTNKIKEHAAFVNAFNASKKKFSHNIKSPLRNIKILEERFQNVLESDEQQLFKSVIDEVSGLAENLVIENPFENEDESLRSELSENLALFDLSQLLSSAIKNKKNEWKEKNIKIDLEMEEFIISPISLIQCAEFKSIISNILNNAIEAGSTTIKIYSRMSESKWIVEVVDDGPGVPEAIKDNLFYENVTYGKDDGTGYGLFHAKKFIEKWNGSITVDSSKTGAKFKIELPIWKVDPVEIDANDTIVLIEDNPTFLRKIRTQLIEQGIKREKIYGFSKSSSFLRWIRKRSDTHNIILFADNDLGPGEQSGLDLIKDFSSIKSGRLVTDGHELPTLVGCCIRYGIKLIPKSHALQSTIVSYI